MKSARSFLVVTLLLAVLAVVMASTSAKRIIPRDFRPSPTFPTRPMPKKWRNKIQSDAEFWPVVVRGAIWGYRGYRAYRAYRKIRDRKNKSLSDIKRIPPYLPRPIYRPSPTFPTRPIFRTMPKKWRNKIQSDAEFWPAVIRGGMLAYKGYRTYRKIRDRKKNKSLSDANRSIPVYPIRPMPKKWRNKIQSDAEFWPVVVRGAIWGYRGYRAYRAYRKIRDRKKNKSLSDIKRIPPYLPRPIFRTMPKKWRNKIQSDAEFWPAVIRGGMLAYKGYRAYRKIRDRKNNKSLSDIKRILPASYCVPCLRRCRVAKANARAKCFASCKKHCLRRK